MANIVKLNYTADEINEKLGKIDDVVQTTGNSETAVMSQKAVTTELDKVIKQISTVGKNLYDKDKKLEGYTLFRAGQLGSEPLYSTSDYIEVEADETYTFSHDGKAEDGWISIVCFYDGEKNFVSYIESPTPAITIPSNACCLRFATSTERMNGNLQLEEGEAATAYQPFTLIPINKKEVDQLNEKVIESRIASVSGGSFVRYDNGKIYAGAKYGSTAFISVNGGETIQIKGFNCPVGSTASVCAYDENFAYIGAIVREESVNEKVLTLGENVAYIRATSTDTGSVVIDYLDRPIAKKTIENAPYDLGTLTANAFVSKTNGAVLTNTSYYGVTDFIEVTARHLKIENPDISGNAGICEYDENHKFISCVLAPEVFGGQYTVRLSANAKYIRATVVNNNAEWLRLYPVSSIVDNEAENVVDAWAVASGNQIKTPHKKINALAPTITFIDDDTMTFDAVKRYHDIFEAKGVKGCYAVVTDYLGESRDPNGELKNLLLSYEEQGFGMLFHAKWQDTYYMEGANRNITLAEADYCKGMRKMREIGFIDYNYWVSPYGVMDTEIAAMCKRHGANCLLSTYNNTFIQNNGMNGNGESVDRYAIPRCSMGANDAEYPNFTLAHLKEQIEKCVQTGGWLIIATHVAQWADEYGTTPDERLGEVIQYALNSGCDIKTFSEAYAERNGIFMLNDIC